MLILVSMIVEFLGMLTHTVWFCPVKLPVNVKFFDVDESFKVDTVVVACARPSRRILRMKMVMRMGIHLLNGETR